MSESDTRTIQKQLQAADDVIGMMRAAKYTNIQHFVFGARLDVRTIVDPEPFEGGGDPKETEKRLLDASLPRVFVTTALENGSPYFRVYGCGDVLALNDNLYGHCIAAVINATYAAVGLATPKGETDQQLVDKIRGENGSLVLACFLIEICCNAIESNCPHSNPLTANASIQPFTT